MSKSKRLAAIAKLLFNNLPINAVSIASEDLSATEVVLSNNIFTRENLLELYSNTSYQLYSAKENQVAAQLLLDTQLAKHLTDVTRLQNYIHLNLIPSIKKLTSMNNKALGETSVHIIDGKELIFEKDLNKEVYSALDNAKYKAFFIENGQTTECITTVVDNSINIEGESISDLPKQIILEIDKQNTKPVNKISIKSASVERIIIGTSDNGIEFEYKNYKQKAIVDNTIDIENTTDRFIRVVFKKHKPTSVTDGKFKYKINLIRFDAGLYIQPETNSFETKTYNIDKTCTSLSIQDKITGAGDIKYQVSINGKDYIDIVSSNRMDLYDKKHIEINEEYENQYLSITSATDIQAEFIATNTLRVFNKEEKWIQNDLGIVGWFRYENAKTINTGTNKIIINGEIKSGVILIPRGNHKINIIDGTYENLFNDRLVSETKVVNNTREILDIYGNTYTVTDVMYPYNCKYLIEDSASISLGQELKSYDLTQTNTGALNIRSNGIKNFNVLYKRTVGTLSTIKIKGTVQNTQVGQTTIKSIFVNISWKHL